MQQPKYITPRLGRRSAAIVTLTCVLMWLVATQYRNSEAFWGDPQKLLAGTMLVLGALYGLVSGICWLATIAENAFVRNGMRLILLITAAYGFTQVGTESWLRSLSNVGGFLIGQSLIYFFLCVPSWESSSVIVRSGEASTKPNQFGIGDVVIVTTSIALLLAIIIRYFPPIESASYWLVMLCVWVIGPLIAAAFSLAALSRVLMVGTGLFVTGLMLAIGGTLGLSFIDARIGDANPSLPFGVSYGLIVLAYSVVVSIVAIAGRIQPVGQRVTEATAVD